MNVVSKAFALLNRRSAENALLLFFSTLLFVEMNVLAERARVRASVSERVDSEVTTETHRFLTALPSDLRVLGLLANEDEDAPALRAFLEQLELRGIGTERIDPDRQRAKYAGLRLGELAPRGTERAALLLVRDGAKALVSLPGPEARRQWSTFRFLERAFVERAAVLLETEPKKVCFLGGHGERSPADASLRGLSELSVALERQRITTVEIDEKDLPADERCDSWAIVGPTTPLPERALTLLEAEHRKGAALAFWLDPLTDGRSEVRPSGVEALAEQVGIRIGASVVIEGDRSRRLVDGEGERFFAVLLPHAVTETVAPRIVDARLAITFSRPIERTDAEVASLLFTSSERGSVLRRLDGRAAPSPSTRPVGLGALSGRVAIFGTSTLVENETLRQSEVALRLAEALFASFHGRPWIASVALHPKKPPHEFLESEARFLTSFALFAWPALLGLAATTFFVLRRRRPFREETS